LSPKQHIALVCARDTNMTRSCCYEDYPENTQPSKGISRLVGEWSAAYDTLPASKLKDVMKGIAKTGEAPEFNRTLSKKRQDFLKQFVEAQMVAYESVSVGVSSGWFYWTLKMEGGAFAEWDFLRGVQEGWIPSLPGISESSESVYGTCLEIAEKTEDDDSLVHEFPDHDTQGLWFGPEIDDDYVLSHAGSLRDDGELVVTDDDIVETKDKTKDESKKDDEKKSGADDDTPSDQKKPDTPTKSSQHSWFPIFFIAFACYAVWHVFFKEDNFRPRGRYRDLDTPTQLSV
jgi:hypothetical protein